MALDNLRGGTKRVVEENTPLNNLRGGTKRVVIVDGGGGSVDYAKTVQRAETMPTADASNAGQQFLYSGESDATYTHGYIYENVATTTSSSASAEQTVGSTLSDIAVDLATLESFTGWTTDNSLQIFYTADGWSVDTTSLGVTYTGTPNVGDAITITYTAESTSYAWTQIDVQPAPSGLPDQTGQSGKFLTTDGTDASWSDKPLVNKATGANALGVGNTGAVLGSQSVAIGLSATTYANGIKGIAIGSSAACYAGNTVAIGYNAQVSAAGAIMINTSNAGKTNSDANTFKVANANGNYEIMSADGTIPTDRFTTTPSADGTYVPTLTISSGVATRTWGSGGGGGLQNTATGTESLGILNDQSGNYNTVVGVKDTDFSSSVNGATTLGYKAVVSSSSEGAVVIGRQAKVGHNNTSDGGIAIGYLSSTTYGGLVSTNAICIGKSSHATGSRSLAIGSQAVSGAAGAIQLGGTSTSSATTNSDANTFKVANANGNFELMDANGNLPADRLASTTGLADGNYRLRLVMASGVPTLEWVAE